MKRESTKQKILLEAVRLFAREGYEAVSVEQIASAVGIKAPSLYKHYRSKRDIFENILRFMEERDREHAEACALPERPPEEQPEAYARADVRELVEFSRRQFRYWTEDAFAASFRRMLTVEQYSSSEMLGLYHQYLGSGPLDYVSAILGSRAEGLAFYGPMHLLYSVYDESEDKEEASAMLDAHMKRWHT